MPQNNLQINPHLSLPIIFNQDLEVNSVNARELWVALGVETEFSHWVKRRIDDAMAEENVDFTVVKKDVMNFIGKNILTIDYIITTDLAKHFCMLEKTENGRKIRDYFIQAEKASRILEKPKQLHPTEEFEKYHTLANFLGLKGEQAAIHANYAIKKLHRTDVLALIEYKPEIKQEDVTMSLTDWIKKKSLKTSARKANLILQEKGLLEGKAGEWKLTKQGLAFGRIVSQEANGKMRNSVEWKESILSYVN